MIQIENDLALFTKKVAPILEREPSLHSMILSLLKRYEELKKPTQLMVSSSNIVGLQTEKERALIISSVSEAEAKKFAEELFQQKIELPGVNGPLPAADAFARTWTRLSGQTMKLALNLRLFELRNIIPPKMPSGFFRLALESDLDLLLKWIKEFHHEAIPHDPLSSDEVLLKSLKQNIEAQNYFLWEDSGECVCWVASSRETEREAWIAPVYTPTHFRGKGYASALVAEVSQRILNRGKIALLFTDLANPTSNSIYQKVGYRPLSDFRHWIFEAKA